MTIELNREEVIGLQETGLLQKEIAKKLGVSVTTLSTFMKENGIETRKPTNYKKPSEEKITIINSVNVGYASMAIEKKRTIKNEDKNLYIPEKWNWRGYA
jgi:orotate phosphoribosyltransferase-like protein